MAGISGIRYVINGHALLECLTHGIGHSAAFTGAISCILKEDLADTISPFCFHHQVGNPPSFNYGSFGVIERHVVVVDVQTLLRGYLKSGVVFGEIFQIHKKENSVAASPNNELMIFQ